MPLELLPLAEASLSPALRKAVGAAVPQPLRLTVARGLVPLPPTDLVVALYQLAHLDPPEDPNGELRDAARATAKDLPDALLIGALPTVREPLVLDFWGRQLVARPRPLQLVLANQATADETFATLAALGSDALLEQIAQNEQRLLRHPGIITSLYLNPRTRMSTAMRAVELAVRNKVEVQNIPCFEDVKAALEADEAAPPDAVDAAFDAALRFGAEIAGLPTVLGPDLRPIPIDEQTAEQQAAAADAAAEAAEAERRASDNIQDVSRLPLAAKLRLAAIGNAFARAQLVRDSNKVIALAAVRSPAMTEQEAERYAANRALHEEVVRYLATNRAFTKRYSVKANLVNNPKCPLSLATGFLAHLTAKDLKQLARSKSVPSALTKAAQGLLHKREPR